MPYSRVKSSVPSSNKVAQGLTLVQPEGKGPIKQQSPIVRTINNFVHITTIADPGTATRLLTIPPHTQPPYLIPSTVLTTTTAAKPKVTSQAAKPISAHERRYSLKARDPKKKSAPASAQTSAHHSLNSSVVELLRESKPPLSDLNCAKIKVKPVVPLDI